MTTLNSKMVITEKLADARFAVQANIYLYNHQTGAEQAYLHTREVNNVGFNQRDAEFCSSLAQQSLAGRGLSAKQVACLQRILPKYHRQLMALVA